MSLECHGFSAVEQYCATTEALDEAADRLINEGDDADPQARQAFFEVQMDSLIGLVERAVIAARQIASEGGISVDEAFQIVLKMPTEQVYQLALDVDEC